MAPPSDIVLKNFEQFEMISHPVKVPKTKKAMSHEDRYNLAEEISKRICSTIANYAGDDFHHRLCALQNFENLLRMGKRVAVVGVNEDNSVSNTVLNPEGIFFFFNFVFQNVYSYLLHYLPTFVMIQMFLRY